MAKVLISISELIDGNGNNTNDYVFSATDVLMSDRVTNVNDAINGKAPSSHNHSASNITSGTLGVARGGTGITSNPSMLTNLASTSAASVFAASPRPGVTGTLPIANGGTGATSASAARTALGAAASSHTHSGTQVTGLTASRALMSNSSGQVGVSSITSTELGYLDGVTSNIQTQLNGKAASSHTHTGTQITGLTANRALVSNSSGQLAVSAVTSTELGYLDGVTSNIQTQLNGKATSSHTHNYAGSSSAGGPATSAVKLATARSISLSGDASGSASFDGSKNISIAATVVNHGTTSIPADTNMNSYTDPGWYYCPANATVATLTNCPTDKAFTLIVTQHAGRNQLLIEYMTGSPRIFTRNFYNNSWGSWYEIYHTGQKPTASEVGAAASSHTHGGTSITGLTASRALVSNSSGQLVVSAVTSTELGYLDGVTSNIQTQLNGKAASSHTHSGTQVTGLTASRALVSNSSGQLVVSPVTSTELGYLDGVTSNIQTQLDSKSGVGKNTNGESYTINGNEEHGSVSCEIFNDYTNNKAYGVYAHAEGQRTTAGNSSHAEGVYTTASGSCSHAEGSYTTASGQNSHAEGYQTTASESYSHAEGYKTTASGQHSHAEGYSTEASGTYSHAEGSYTTASETASHTEGQNTIASGISSHAEGASTTASGYSSHAEGYDTTASGENSHAEGYQTTASHPYSHAEGYKTTASGYHAHAEGSDTEASETASHAEGIETIASGRYGSHAEGCGTLASGQYSHAEGYETIASETSSHAEGSYSEASGSQSHAEGRNTEASGENSHAEGYNTTASGNSSHAEGYGTTASGSRSHAEGQSTTASGDYGSHAEGCNTTASGGGSHAEGYNTTASKDYSHAEGYGTLASSNYQHVQGKWNVEDASGKYAHIVGWGTSTSARKNIFTITTAGAGKFTSSCTATSHPTSSSRRFKENIRDIDITTIDNLFKIEPKMFDLKEEYGGDKDQVGFIAEDIEPLFPSCVFKDDEGNVASIDYSKFIPYIIKLLQEWAPIIESVKNNETK